MRAGEEVAVIARPPRLRRAATDARREPPASTPAPPPPRGSNGAARLLAAGLAIYLSFETATARAAVPAAADLSFETPASRAFTASIALPSSREAPVASRPFAPRFRWATRLADLSFAAPAPSPRDLAYEQGQAAKEAGDDVRAAEEFARAYRLTPADETGPRLMLLRESVDARLRAHQRGAGAREQLCPARGLLREHLAGADPLADERARLDRIAQGLGAVDCDAPERPAPQDPAPSQPVPEDTPPASPRPVPPDSSPVPPATSPATGPSSRPAPEDISFAPRRPTRPGRALRIAGATVLGVGAAALVPMGVGIALARDATRDGRRVCWGMDIACDGGDNPEVREILQRGYDADRLVRIAAPIAGVALLTGLVLLSVGLAVRGRAPVAVGPRFGPGNLGIGLQGRF